MLTSTISWSSSFIVSSLKLLFSDFRKKDDKPKSTNEESEKKAATPDNNMSAQRSSEKLAAEGKYQTPPMSLLVSDQLLIFSFTRKVISLFKLIVRWW